ncbi:MAG TPA: DNA methyltransferase [Phycisphaerae bacterium]|nr:DNA methyltransferase [Phycisphaerae bacterium]
MKIDVPAVRKCLKSFDFKTLFREHLGWDNHQAQLDIPVDGNIIHLTAVAQKRGFVAFTCPSIPERATRLKIDHQITKSAREHFVIYADQPAGQQVWQWVRREPGKPMASRYHRFDTSQSGDPLIQRLEQIAFSLDEEEKINLMDVAGRARAAFDVDKVTKKFYVRFKAEHDAFCKVINGIKADADLQWYTSLMLNRLMFVYFIQKKGFLDGDTDYLRNRLTMVQQAKGKDRFQSFYRYFLLRLFHDGLGKSPDARTLDPVMERLLGKVPYLNGGFFEVHELEQRYPDIDIPDKAFEKLFDFFDQYSWHLDERPLRADNEINPDVVGYIFEKYINQKQMGAYYTKEDITDYISKNTVIPFLFNAAEEKCAVAFSPGSALWRLLRDDPDRYIYPAVRHGVIDEQGNIIPLPQEIEAGLNEVAKRDGWNRHATEPYALPTETWREHVARRQRCLDIREKLHNGEVYQINDLITLNLDIWQFARDAIVNSEGPELLRAFWHAIDKVTVLDPTCGSGAFLFAASRILETLYSDCLERMERFVEDLADKPHHPEQYSDFKKVLAQIAKHPNERYFILKSIIINNLFGVDIMEEAVEICKLRLFLKLVAQVERVEDIEPLPDIDFNIRAGNTLVGYATADQVRKAFTEERAGDDVQRKLLLGRAADDYQSFEESLLIVDRVFCQFRDQQTTHGGKVTHKDKQELRNRLAKLDTELDCYLAVEYGVNVAKQKDFDAWKASHKPFHWFVEFYGIIQAGGFDVIIGNPPYVEYKDVCSQYTVTGFSTEKCKNLFAYVLERSARLTCDMSRIGMIVPLSAFSTDRMIPLIAELKATSSICHISSFSWRPGKLFDGANLQLSIALIQRGKCPTTIFSTRYILWDSIARPELFSKVEYAMVTDDRLAGSVPKLGVHEASSILAKLRARKSELGNCIDRGNKNVVYYRRGGLYWKVFVDFETGSSEEKQLPLRDGVNKHAVIAALSSNLWFWYFTSTSDCRHLGNRDINSFPFNPEDLDAPDKRLLSELGREYVRDLRKNAETKVRVYKGQKAVECMSFFIKRSKDLIDEIDLLIGTCCGFSKEELDFVRSYDIKYRLSADGEDDDE